MREMRLLRDSFMNQGNGNAAETFDKRTGKEQWLPAGKHVYFEGTRTLQDNVHRDKLGINQRHFAQAHNWNYK